MQTYAISFGVIVTKSLGESGATDQTRRWKKLVGAAFSLGAAWHGGQKAIFLRSALKIDEVMSRLLAHREWPDDLILVVQVAPDLAVRHSGLRFDEDGFEAIFSDATR
ncbi:MAG TPA: hypothetical protein VME40_12240 [Caulobacteraceae bacterium]|nr:hypothetical protein [Caulobacteraceae bacterium]